MLREGRIAYRRKVPRKGRTPRVMAPMEFMARLAALIPRPKIPKVRYHGVFAPRSSWRPLVTPKPPPGARPKPCAAAAPPQTPTSGAALPAAPPASTSSASTSGAASPVAATPAPPPPPKAASFVAAPALAVAPFGLTAGAVATEPVVTVDPTLISVAHGGRLEEGTLFAWSRRIEWAVMMKRSLPQDALAVDVRHGDAASVAEEIDEPSRAA